jgi:signal transduction histidine kinase
MSHELRTPLNAIIGYADLLAEETGSAGEEKLCADAHRIRTAGQRLLVLVEEALNLSDLDAGRLSVRSLPVDVADLVAEAAEAARPLLSEVVKLSRDPTGTGSNRRHPTPGRAPAVHRIPALGSEDLSSVPGVRAADPADLPDTGLRPHAVTAVK